MTSREPPQWQFWPQARSNKELQGAVSVIRTDRPEISHGFLDENGKIFDRTGDVQAYDQDITHLVTRIARRLCQQPVRRRPKER